jgi:hypothetical protein
LSWGKVDWVYRFSPYKGAVFAVHVALADTANADYGWKIWFGQETIAEKARTTRQTVNKALQAMIDDGFLELLEDNSRRLRPNVYRMLYPEVPIVFDSGSVASDDTSVASDDTSVASGAATVVSGDTKPESNPKKPKGSVSPDGDAPSDELVHLCELLADLVENDVGRKPKIKPIWYREMSLLLRRGPTDYEPAPINPDSVERLLRFVYEHRDADPNFSWAAQMRSPSGLRRNWVKAVAWAKKYRDQLEREERGDDENGWMDRSIRGEGS